MRLTNCRNEGVGYAIAKIYVNVTDCKHNFMCVSKFIVTWPKTPKIVKNRSICKFLVFSSFSRVVSVV